jgi:hypothetical protein
MTDQEKIKRLQSQGLTVEVINLSAKKFNERYRAYAVSPYGNKVAMIDEDGNIIAKQG